MHKVWGLVVSGERVRGFSGFRGHGVQVINSEGCDALSYFSPMSLIPSSNRGLTLRPPFKARGFPRWGLERLATLPCKLYIGSLGCSLFLRVLNRDYSRGAQNPYEELLGIRGEHPKLPR